METSRFSDSRIIAILKRAEAGSPVRELCREHGIGNATLYKWRARSGSWGALPIARTKALADANRRLKKMYGRGVSRPRSWPRRGQKSGSAISAAREGAMGRGAAVSHD